MVRDLDEELEDLLVVAKILEVLADPGVFH